MIYRKGSAGSDPAVPETGLILGGKKTSAESVGCCHLLDWSSVTYDPSGASGSCAALLYSWTIWRHTGRL